MSGFNNRPNIAQRAVDNLASNISGIFSTKQQAKYMSGARCILKVNSKISAFAFAISWRINTTVTENNTIDDYLPYELIPQRVTVEGTIGGLHIPGRSVGTELWQADVLSFLQQKYIQIEVRDVASDQLLFFTAKAMITGRSEDLRVDDLANVQITFKAIGFRDERLPEPPTFPEESKGASDNSSILGSIKDKISSFF